MNAIIMKSQFFHKINDLKYTFMSWRSFMIFFVIDNFCPCFNYRSASAIYTVSNFKNMS